MIFGMNLASLILLAFIILALIYGVYRIRQNKGACEDCDVKSCPVHQDLGELKKK